MNHSKNSGYAPYQDDLQLRWSLTRLPAHVVNGALQCYRAPGRYYHNVDHLARMLRTADQYEMNLSEAQLLAILFHDAVYKTSVEYGANERDSAQMLVRDASSYVDTETINQAQKMILCTIDHLAQSEAEREVIDLDLAGLATDIQTVHRDGVNVYLENQHLISWHQYQVARAKFFEKMLARPVILTSQALRHLEPKLRENLKAVMVIKEN